MVKSIQIIQILIIIYYYFLKTQEEKIKSEKIDFSDDPDEFCNQIITELILGPVKLPKIHLFWIEKLLKLIKYLNTLVKRFNFTLINFI